MSHSDHQALALGIAIAVVFLLAALAAVGKDRG
jgi:hypothetical protein